MSERDDLLKYYELALAEYRHQVQLNWDRTKYYLILNSAILAAGVGFIKNLMTGAEAIFVAALFALGVFVALLGRHSSRKGREYYHATVAAKTLLESKLGLVPEEVAECKPGATIGVFTARGMRKTRYILHDTDAYLSKGTESGSTIVGDLDFILGLFAWVDVAAIVFAVLRGAGTV